MDQMMKRLAIFSGSVNQELAEGIAKELGISLGDVKLKKFENGEIYARYQESIRGADVFIVQSVARGLNNDVNDALMELLIMVDAAKRASARTITAVVAHYGYARQDRKAASREPITAKLVADLLTAAGITRLMTVDLHQGQIQGFFNMPVDHFTALDLLADYFKKKFGYDEEKEEACKTFATFAAKKLCVVSPDVGRAKAAKKLSEMLGSDLAIMHKDRPEHNRAEITALIGNVEGKICLINDDMIDTGGTIVAAAETLLDKGAEEVYVCCTHPVFSGPAIERLENSRIKEVVVCDTIQLPELRPKTKITTVSVASLFALGIQRIYTNNSIHTLRGSDAAL